MNAIEAKAAVDTGIQQMLEDPERWRQWATTMSRFHQYSPGNVLLILSQRPGATQVAGYHAWQALGRQVQSGERGITVLAPIIRRGPEAELTTSPDQPAPPQGLVGFRTATVFDISQTRGRDLALPEPQLLDGQGLATLLGSLTAAVGVPVMLAESDALGGANGVWNPRAGTITLAADRSPDQQVKTLLHEWSHSLGVPDATAALDRHVGGEEIAAETTAFVLAQRLGLDSAAYSIPYVGHWAAGDPRKVWTLAQSVSQRVQSMSTALEQAAQHDPVIARALGMAPVRDAESQYEMEA